MKKRILAILLSITLVVSGLFVGLSRLSNKKVEAAEEDTGVVISGKYDHKNGLYRLEAYAEGSAVIVSTKVRLPIDIVFVLDTSGSMEDGTILVDTFSSVSDMKAYFEDVTSTSDYGYLLQNSSGTDTTSIRVNNGVLQYYNRNSWSTFEGSSFESGYTGSVKLYEYRIQGLKNAAKKALETIYNDAVTNKVVHNVSIVTFASSASVKANSLSITDNYSSLQSIIDGLESGGATYADSAMESAYNIINTAYNNTERESTKTVLFFTDGYPTHNNGFECDVAADAITQAKKIKDLGATVYSISCMEDVSPEESISTSYSYSYSLFETSKTYDDDMNTLMQAFMHAISSNFPSATATGSYNDYVVYETFKFDLTYGSGSTSNGYFKAVSNDIDFTTTFTTIVEETLNASVKTELSVEAYVQTVLFSQYFTLPEDADIDDIKVYYQTYDGKTEKFSGIDVVMEDAIVTVDTNEEKVTVSNFDFAGNWCGPNATNGRKLVIVIPVERTEEAPEGDDVQVIDWDKSGIYDENGEKVGGVAEVVVPAYTITIDENGGEEVADVHYVELDDVTLPDGPVKTGYTFTNWVVTSIGTAVSEGGTWTLNAEMNPGDVVQLAKGNATIKALYTPNNYTITFKNYDGTVLQSSQFAYDTTPSYSGETPTRAATAQFTYTFKGWDTPIANVTGDTVYTATYNSVVNCYAITWNNYDGKNLETDSSVEYGMVPSYDGATPVKPEDSVYTYTFTGWSPEVASVTGAQTYVAQFSSTEKTVTISYIAKSGGSVSVTSEVINISTGTAQGSTATANKFYKFIGWFDNSDCTGDAISTSATFVPEKVSDLNVGKTYYALFEIDVCDVTITKTVEGQDEISQSFVFTITSKTDESFNMTVVIHGSDFVEGTASVVIKNLPYGEYTVSEDTSWAWQYNTESSTQDVDTKESAEITFVNTYNSDIYWLDEISAPVKNIRKKADD